jgi:hypothetical protein
MASILVRATTRADLNSRRRLGRIVATAKRLAPASLTSALWHAGVMVAPAELTAVSSTLQELTERLGRIIAELSPAEQERYGTDLMEVERVLGVASRRLVRLVAR